MSDKGKKWFRSMGSKAIDNLEYGFAFAFVGEYGTYRENCFEKRGNFKMPEKGVGQDEDD